MRRLWLIAAGALVVAAACGDDEDGGSAATDAATDEVMDEVPGEEDFLVGDTGDNTGDDNTGSDDDPDPSDIAPIEVLDSFTGSFDTEIQFESGSIVLLSDAVFVKGDQDCTVVTDPGDGTDREDRAVAVGDEAFYSEDGVGVRTDLDNPDVVSTLDNCVSSESFWDGFVEADDLDDGSPADFNGIPSERFDLLDDPDTLDDLLDIPAGFEFEQFDIWVADDGGYAVGTSIRYSGNARDCREFIVGGLGAGESCTVRLAVRIADPDDSSLRVRLPRG